MRIRHHVSLAKYSTMRLGGKAAHLVKIKKRADIVRALAWAEERKLPVIMIGHGSNIVWKDSGFSGLVLVNAVQHFAVFQEDAENYYVTIGSGNEWDTVVAKTVSMGLTGIEALSLIPGTTGATPVQNVGAYGQEIGDTLVSVEAFDQQSQSFVTIPRLDCHLGYRTSRFKTTDKGRFLITAITLHLKKGTPTPPFYQAVQDYFTEHGLTQITPQTLRSAVIAIRSSKMPDPARVANNGSFFANPIVSQAVFEKLHAKYPHIAHWKLANDMVKLSAAWLVETAGFKGFHDPETGMATWPKQPLVLVNEHAVKSDDLLRFKHMITSKVHAMFGVTLEQEPELLGD